MRVTKAIIETLNIKAVLEYNAEVTARNYGDKIAQVASSDPVIVEQVKDPETGKVDPVKNRDAIVALVLKYLEDMDFTNNKGYVQFLAKVYGAGGQYANIEDMGSTFLDILMKYEKLKKKNLLNAEHRDVMRFKTAKNFVDVVDTYELPTEDEEDAQDEAKRGSYQEMYNDSNARIIWTKDKKSNQYYGQNTKWCTAATSSNYFDHYAKDGPLYVILPKNPSHVGEKYQVHFQSTQFKDERDDEVASLDIIKNAIGNKAFQALFRLPGSESLRTKYFEFIGPEYTNDVFDRFYTQNVMIAKILFTRVNKALTNKVSEETLTSILEVIDTYRTLELAKEAGALKNRGYNAIDRSALKISEFIPAITKDMTKKALSKVAPNTSDHLYVTMVITAISSLSKMDIHKDAVPTFTFADENAINTIGLKALIAAMRD